MSTSPRVLVGNMLSVTDSDFESGSVGNWQNNWNASLASSSAYAFSGSKSLAMTAVVSGNAAVQSNAGFLGYPAAAGTAYVFSANVRAASAGRTGQLQVNCYNAALTFLGTINGPTVQLIAGQWTPLTIAFSPLPSTALVYPVISASGLNASETVNIDLAYLAKSMFQVLVDWANSPIGSSSTAGAAFSDITAWTKLQDAVTLTRGRQDSISTVQPGRLTLKVDNSNGWFTPQKSTSPWYPGVLLGRRVQLNVADEAGAWHTRFDGQVAQIDLDPAITGQEATAAMTCSDALALLNRQPDLSSWTVQMTRALSPALQYVMDEPANSQGLQDSSGNNGPTLPLFTFAGTEYPLTFGVGFQGTVTGPTATYQSGNNPVEGAVEPTTSAGFFALTTSPVASPLSSVEFAATINATPTNLADTGCSAQFQGPLPFALKAAAGNAFTLLAWVWPNIAATNYQNINYATTIACLGNVRTGSTLSMGMLPGTSGSGTYEFQLYNNFLLNQLTINAQSSIGITSPQGNGPVMVALVVNGTTATGYVGGNLFGVGETLKTSSTFSIPSGFVFNYLSIGGMLGGGLGWIGNISNVCVYESALTSTQLTTLSNYGAHGPMNSEMGANVSQLATFANLPSYWTGTLDNGLSADDYIDVTGSNVVSTMQAFTSVEHGLYFVDATGKLNVHDRSRRMGYGAPALTLPAGSYNVGLQPKWTDQGLTNSEALQNERGGLGIVATSQPSGAAYGAYANGNAQSPQTAPYYTWAGGVTYHRVDNSTSQLVQEYQNGNILDAASWDVNTLGTPGMKLASVTVDMLGNVAGHGEYVAPSALYALEIDQVIGLAQALPWWPDSPQVGELFIEGVSESYSTTGALITFYTSPAFQGRAWQPGSSAYGQLDVSARVGISESLSTFTDGPIDPVPTYSTSMNAGGGGGFVGAKDQRGLSVSLQQVSTPPLLFAQQGIFPQTLTSGVAAFVVWDTTTIDTMQGMGLYATGQYLVQLPGWYEVYFTGQFTGQNTNYRTIWIAHQQIGGSLCRKVAPASVRGTGANCGVTTSAVFWCNIGDGISAQMLQDSGANLTTSVANGGSHLSLRYLGNGAARN